MYCYKDNFLSDELFNLFKEDMLNKYEPRKEWVTDNGEMRFGKYLSGENYKEDAPVRVMDLAYPEDGNYMYTAVKLGSKSLPEIARSIKQYMIECMNLINPLARQMWYQYHSKKHKIISHLDQAVKDKTSKQSFTSLLYMHDNWEDSWGGELTFLNDKQSILPKPNRLIIYSRDEEHWVNEITHDLDDYQRMLFFTAWGTDNDF
jgi:Rps23 Pro-64 3,4-dihydroxylase Tpa1-like proline 4-hydroxylase